MPVPKPPAAGKGRNRNLVLALAGCRARRVGADRRQHPVHAWLRERLRAGHHRLTGTTPADTTDAPSHSSRASPRRGRCWATPARRCGCSSSRTSSAPSARVHGRRVACDRRRIREARPLKLDFRGFAHRPRLDKALRIAIAAGFQDKLWQVVGLFYEKQGEENSGWVTDSPDRRDPRGGAGARCGQGQGGARERRRDQGDRGGPAQATALRCRVLRGSSSASGSASLFDPGRAYTPSEFRPAIDDALKG